MMKMRRGYNILKITINQMNNAINRQESRLKGLLLHPFSDHYSTPQTPVVQPWLHNYSPDLHRSPENCTLQPSAARKLLRLTSCWNSYFAATFCLDRDQSKEAGWKLETNTVLFVTSQRADSKNRHFFITRSKAQHQVRVSVGRWLWWRSVAPTL